MERTTYELLIIVLMAVLVIGIVFCGRFVPRKKRNSGTVSQPIPLWRRWTLRASDPSRCDCCRAEAQAPESISGPLRVEAWSSRRSKGGRKKTVDSMGHFCPNPECKYHESRDPKTHALVSNGRHGRQGIRQWREACQACGSYVSERHDSVMSNLKKHPDDVARTLEMLNRGASQADVAAHHKHTPRTVRTWLKKVAVQSLRVLEKDVREVKKV